MGAYPRLYKLTPGSLFATKCRCVQLGGINGALSGHFRTTRYKPPILTHTRYEDPSKQRVSILGDFRNINPRQTIALRILRGETRRRFRLQGVTERGAHFPRKCTPGGKSPQPNAPSSLYIKSTPQTSSPIKATKYPTQTRYYT